MDRLATPTRSRSDHGTDLKVANGKVGAVGIVEGKLGAAAAVEGWCAVRRKAQGAREGENRQPKLTRQELSKKGNWREG